MSGPHPRRPGTRAVPVVPVVVLVAVLAAAATGCGTGTDDVPRPLEVSTTSTVPAAPTTDGTQQSALWVVRDDRLVPLTRELPDQQPATVLDALVRLPADEVPVDGATNEVPEGTEVLGTELSGGTLTVDLSGRFDRVVGPARQAAVAQVVLTAVELPGVERVRFEVEGEAVNVPSPEQGDVGVVTDCDVAPLVADPDSPESSGLSARSAARLAARSDELADRCG